MAVDHKFTGTEEEGIAILQLIKKALARRRGVRYVPDPGDLLLTPAGLLHVSEDEDAVDTATGEDFDQDLVDQADVDTELDDTPPDQSARRKGA